MLVLCYFFAHFQKHKYSFIPKQPRTVPLAKGGRSEAGGGFTHTPYNLSPGKCSLVFLF